MNHLLAKLLAPCCMEYISVSQNLVILETSPGVDRFADRPEDVFAGNDIRVAFPELIGAEEILKNVLEGKRASFEITGIAKPRPENKPFYINLYACQYQNEVNLQNQLLLLFEDVTENMVMKQKLVQTANETSLLLSALASSQDYIHKIISSMADALLVTNKSGLIKTINLAAESLFGYEEKELLGQPISMLMAETDFLLQHQSSLNWGQDIEISSDLEVCCRKKNGSKFIVSFSCSTIKTELNGGRDFVYIGRDVTEQKQAEKETQKALDKQKELNQLRSNFISMTSHEFRTPLTIILTSVELLESFYDLPEKNTPRIKQYFKMIDTAIHQMTDMLDEVLLLSKAEAGKLTFQPSLVDVTKFSQEIMKEMELSKKSKHTLKFISPSEPIFAWLDEKLLRQILGNLLSNAIKYSPFGGKIELKLMTNEDSIFIEVSDQGMGILPEDQDRLFDSFYRGKNVHHITGTGLGLAIVKNSVDLHGGEVTIESKVGEGTIFKVRLPIKHNPAIG